MDIGPPFRLYCCDFELFEFAELVEHFELF